jgi:hypothetical protein
LRTVGLSHTLSHTHTHTQTNTHTHTQCAALFACWPLHCRLGELEAALFLLYSQKKKQHSQRAKHADTQHDHIHQGQDRSENGSQPTLEPVLRGVHCVAQHFQNAAQCTAKLLGKPILRPIGGRFRKAACEPFSFLSWPQRIWSLCLSARSS